MSSSLPTSKLEHFTNGVRALDVNNTKKRRSSLHPGEERSARDPRDEAVVPLTNKDTSSPNQYPALDFDGLSWPSELYHFLT